jgi:D-3-phosphoglycerate dehydrogenase
MAPQLKFIQRLGVGFDNIDLSAARAAGVMVANTPGANATAVAEHTVMLILAAIKRLIAADQGTRQGQWPFEAVLAAGVRDLADMTVGLVGIGQIGQAGPSGYVRLAAICGITVGIG